MNKIFQIYDSTFKRILTLSDKAVINLINGLFGTEHPTDSKITYNWTEYENKDLKRILADSILTINDRDIYHIEAQMTEDDYSYPVFLIKAKKEASKSKNKREHR